MTLCSQQHAPLATLMLVRLCSVRVRLFIALCPPTTARTLLSLFVSVALYSSLSLSHNADPTVRLRLHHTSQQPSMSCSSWSHQPLAEQYENI
ncbi:NADH-quinone oxidoreductase subunit NuoB [Sesbania bispinosa]|nr:NADH-quinone oxidoreductase subunit NuoB [Sesbania bispinosa]